MYRNKGFTLIEVMVTVAVIGILASIALPSYSEYIFRSRVPAMMDGLGAFGARMEQRYQDVGNYGTDACAVADQSLERFSVTCALTNAGQGFTATATGTGALDGVEFSLDQNGTRQTVKHPKGVPGQACWTTRGKTCDS